MGGIARERRISEGFAEGPKVVDKIALGVVRHLEPVDLSAVLVEIKGHEGALSRAVPIRATRRQNELSERSNGA
ncbi:MAG: hypothetical protein AAF416_04335 [Pseudomonadota bacterium]